MNNFETILETFDKKIDHVRRSEVGVPKSFDIDLAVPLTDWKYDLGGNLFYVVHAPDDTVYIEVKINGTNQQPIRYYRGMGCETPFHTLYITTPAGQAGTITVLYATEAPELMRIIDNRSSTSLGITTLLAELQGDTTPENWGEVTVGVAAVQLLAANANRKACWIHADINNSGNVYLGFTNGVTTAVGGNLWFAVLAPGQGWGVDDYRGTIFGIGTAAGQLVGTGEW